jgi:hypothetical protein
MYRNEILGAKPRKFCAKSDVLCCTDTRYSIAYVALDVRPVNSNTCELELLCF